MIIWLASYPRSGNTFLRLVLNRFFGVKTFSLYDDPNVIGADPVLADAVGHVSHGCQREAWVREARESAQSVYVKTHGLPDDDSKAIALVRDGRAAIVSYCHYRRDFARERLSLPEIVLGDVWAGDWSTNAQAWTLSGRPNTLVLKYEELITGESEPLDRIADFLHLPKPSAARIEFSELQTLSPRFFSVGSNAARVEELETDCPALFWSVHGETMLRLGYVTEIPSFRPAQLAAEVRRYGLCCSARGKCPLPARECKE